jgi:hypothetical protein
MPRVLSPAGFVPFKTGQVLALLALPSVRFCDYTLVLGWIGSVKAEVPVHLHLHLLHTGHARTDTTVW